MGYPLLITQEKIMAPSIPRSGGSFSSQTPGGHGADSPVQSVAVFSLKSLNSPRKRTDSESSSDTVGARSNSPLRNDGLLRRSTSSQDLNHVTPSPTANMQVVPPEVRRQAVALSRNEVCQAALHIYYRNGEAPTKVVASQIQTQFPDRPFIFTPNESAAVKRKLREAAAGIHHEANGNFYDQNNELVQPPRFREVPHRKAQPHLHPSFTPSRLSLATDPSEEAKRFSLNTNNYLAMWVLLKYRGKPADVKPALEKALKQQLPAKKAASLVDTVNQLIIERKPYLNVAGELMGAEKRFFSTDEKKIYSEAIVQALVKNNLYLTLEEANKLLHDLLGKNNKLPPVHTVLQTLKTVAAQRIKMEPENRAAVTGSTAASPATVASASSAVGNR
jgi:hypothetical protein